MVSDRFSGSTLAYQGYGRGLDVGELAWLSSWAAEGLEPDLVVLLDVDQAVAAARRCRPRDRMEAAGDAFHQRVVAGYLALAAADPDRWVVVDGSGTVDEVAARVWSAFEAWAGGRSSAGGGAAGDATCSTGWWARSGRSPTCGPRPGPRCTPTSSSGRPGTGRRTAALALAAALLCPRGRLRRVRRVRPGRWPACIPTWSSIEREGAFLGIDQAREIRRLAMRTPNEAARKVLVLPDFHLAQDAVPALLKVVEEPPPSTVFVILADHVPPELVTIASRCVRIDFGPLPRRAAGRRRWSADGVDPAVAADVAEAAGGRLDRARLLASDPGFAARRAAWRSVPSRLDGTGATVAVLAAELVELLGTAGGGAARGPPRGRGGRAGGAGEALRRAGVGAQGAGRPPPAGAAPAAHRRAALRPGHPGRRLPGRPGASGGSTPPPAWPASTPSRRRPRP